MTTGNLSALSIADHLRYCRSKDNDQHGYDGGFRSTRDIAEAFSVSLATARRRLHALATGGVVDMFDNGASGTQGNPISWRIADHEFVSGKDVGA